MSRCGVYVENGPPVPVLSGAGLYVEDSDHNEIFLMSKAEITLVTRDTSDFEEVLLNATYLYEGVEQTFSGGSKFGSHCIAGKKVKKISIYFSFDTHWRCISSGIHSGLFIKKI